MHPYVAQELAKAHMEQLRVVAEEFRRVRLAERAGQRGRHGRPARTPAPRIGAPADTRS